MPAEAAPSWLYVPAIGGATGPITLPEDEAHYVSHVCRARSGDRATATDGRGTVAELELTRVGKEVEARVVSLDHTPRSREAWVWCGAPESGRADWLVEKLAELGVSELQPLECARGGWERFAARRDRF